MLNDTKTSRASDRPVLNWARRHILRRWPQLAAVGGALLLRTGVELFGPWPLKVLIDEVLAPRLNAGSHRLAWILAEISREEAILYCAVATVVLFGLARVAAMLSAFVNFSLSRRLNFDVAVELFSNLQRQSLSFHLRSPTGELVRRVGNDSNCIAILARDAIVPLFASLTMLLAMFVVLCRLSAMLAIVSAVAALPIFFLVRRYAQPMQRWSTAQHSADGRFYAVIEQALSAVPIIQAFGRELHFDTRLQRAARQSRSALLNTTRVQVEFKFLIGLATAAGSASVLGLGAYLVMQDTLSVGSLLVFLAYLASVYAPLESLAYSTAAFHTAVVSARRVHELITATPQVRESPHAVALSRAAGRVDFDQVRFGYESTQTVLADVSLTVAAGERIAIVGRTGAGKSTLLSLIPRFMDVREGAVRVDGLDVRDLRLRDLRAQVAVVPQDPLLFPVSIAENIAYGRPDAPFDEVRRAAIGACVHEFIHSLPRGYDTVVGQRGSTLSLGQRQRIAVARALLKNAPIVLLDEPTSALDVETEFALVRALEHLLQDRTAFIIAHRLSTARAAQRIAVLDEGRLVECGTHAELLARGAHYAGLFGLAQAGDGREGAPHA
jgi:ATP-binding cassette subfamily B protein